MRIAPKAASNSPATPQAAPAKGAGASFLDILAAGSGVDIFGIRSAGSNSQAGSDEPSNSTQDQSQKGSASTFQAELSAGASADASAVLNATAADQGGLAQGSAEQISNQQIASQQIVNQQDGDGANGQTANSNLAVATVSTTTALVGLGAPAKITAAQLLFASQTVLHSTGKGQKQQSQTSGAAANVPVAAAADVISTLANAVPAADNSQTAAPAAKQNLNAQIAATLVLPIDASTSRSGDADPSAAGTTKSGADQASADSAAPQAADTPLTAFSKAQQIASQQMLANARPLQNGITAAQTPVVKTGDGTQSSSTDGNNATVVNGGAASQIASQGSVATTAPALASTYLSAAMFPNSFDASQSAGKASDYQTPATTFNSNANVSSAATATSQVKSSSPDASGNSSQSAPAANGTAQHTPIDASQAIGVAGKAADNATVQAISSGVPAVPHQTPSPLTTAASASESAHRSGEAAGLASEPATAAGTGASSGINSARVLQSMSETEMRVGMRSTEFGDISIRTMVSQQQMQAQISVDHNELSSAISAHIPAIQAKLGNEYGLHASIEVSQNSAGFSGDQGQSSQRDQRPFKPSIQLESAAASTESGGVVLRVPQVASDGDRLDIRA